MNKSGFTIAVVFVVLLMGGAIWYYETSQTRQESDSVSFVRDFYRWYVPLALSSNHGPASDLALKDRATSFSAKLLQALREDSDAQKNAGEEGLVGLDFDPFLNTQDPCEQYIVGKASKDKDENYVIEVYGVCSGERSQSPAVLADVVRENGNWVFTNFIYNSRDLLSTLKMLQQERSGHENSL
jgi:hypothetical protein